MINRMLVANRGEIAVRIVRAAGDLCIETVGVAPVDDWNALHVQRVDVAVELAGRGAAAYLDAEQLVEVARANGCDAIHPGYGFLSESASFAALCAANGIKFVGPSPEVLAVLGDKAAARDLARKCEVPVLDGGGEMKSGREVAAFMKECGGPVMLKAVSGGGGRGIRLVRSMSDAHSSFELCRSEAKKAFGDSRLYIEKALIAARHIEVQIVGDGSGTVADLGERDCSLQRRNQKLIEIAPSPALTQRQRKEIVEAARRLASCVHYESIGTFEFLVDGSAPDGPFYFLEANPRLQVEHPVTEELWDVDLVQTQLRLASGDKLSELVLPTEPRPGFVIECRLNAETMLADGTLLPSAGTITSFTLPTGPGARVDTHAYEGYSPSFAYDSLLAKIITSTRLSDFPIAVAKARSALSELRIDGLATNRDFLSALLEQDAVAAGRFTTGFVDEHLEMLVAGAAVAPPSGAPTKMRDHDLRPGELAVESPINGQLVTISVQPGEEVAEGQAVAIVEAMKMEHVIAAPAAGVIQHVDFVPGRPVAAGDVLATMILDASAGNRAEMELEADPAAIRPDLQEVFERQKGVLDDARPDAVERRRQKNSRTARENIAAVCDPGTFVEYGSLVVAAQRARRPIDELIARTPADGVVVGFGNVNGAIFDDRSAQTLLIAFDDTVLAGTMGEMAREKLKHCLEAARQQCRPVILFAEGGGGRAGDTDLRVAVTGWTMDVSSYYQLGRLSGLAPLIGVVHGRCFAANAGMLACCDVIIATKDANIGVGGPAMIEGGRLGRFAPEEIGPAETQLASGVIDLLAEDEIEAAALAKKYLGYFQGSVAEWEAADQQLLRAVIPENRLRAYEVRSAISLLADVGSVLELRRGFGIGIVTCLARIDGKPLGIVANNPLHLGGAINADAADKASRFMRLCEAFGLPVLFLCDTPGVMVGPDAETEGTVRKMGRMFVTGANLTVPFFTIVLRKAYGIGAELMAGGWFKAPRFLVSWPTGELGGMNIEGNVTLAHAAELAAIEDPSARRARFDELVREMHERGRALSVATHFEIDNVIDPAESRTWIRMAMAAHQPKAMGEPKRVPFVDPY